MTPDIIIEKINEVYYKIHCEKYILLEIEELFSFWYPGFKFMDSYKYGRWDGKFRIFSPKNRLLYCGLAKLLEDYCKEKGYIFNYLNDEDVSDILSKEYFIEYVKSLNIHSNGKKIDVRDYQIEYIYHILKNKRATIISPTRSGKTLTLYILLRYLLDHGLVNRGIVVVPNTSLVRQAFADFGDYSSEIDWDVNDNCHMVYSGKEKISDKKIIFSTWQSIYKLTPKYIKGSKYFEQFDFIVGDECHESKATEFTEILSSCINSKFRVGFTGTLQDAKCHALQIQGMFGKAIQLITTKELMDRGQVTNLEINSIILQYGYKKFYTYEEEIEYIITNEKRHKYIKNLISTLEKNTLVLFNFEEHGKYFYNMLKNSEKFKDRKIYFINGNTPIKLREKYKEEFEGEKDAVIVASFGVFSTGLTVRNLHYLVTIHPRKDKIKTLQAIGRTLTLSENKNLAVLFDIMDDYTDFSYDKTYLNHAYKHGLERIKIYKKEKFKFNKYKIVLR